MDRSREATVTMSKEDGHRIGTVDDRGNIEFSITIEVTGCH